MFLPRPSRGPVTGFSGDFVFMVTTLEYVYVPVGPLERKEGTNEMVLVMIILTVSF